MERTKDDPVCFRPRLGLRDRIDVLARESGLTYSEWLEMLVEREVQDHATAVQRTPREDDRADPL